MGALAFWPSERFAERPSVDPLSSWIYVHVLPPEVGAVARTVDLGGIAIDLDSSGIVRGFETPHDSRRSERLIVVPDTDGFYWMMRFESRSADVDMKQYYDPEHGTLMITRRDESKPLFSRRLSANVTVSCTAQELQTVYIQDVWFRGA